MVSNIYNSIKDQITVFSRSATDSIISFLNSKGLSVSSRWAGLLLFFISLLIIFLGMKISQPFVKTLLFIIGGILAIGLVIPW